MFSLLVLNQKLMCMALYKAAVGKKRFNGHLLLGLFLQNQEQICAFVLVPGNL